MTARDTARRNRATLGLVQPSRWAIAVSDQAHSSIVNTANIIDVDVVQINTGDDDRLTGAALRAHALAHPEDFERLCAIVATGGTTNAGIIDDLEGVGQFASEHSIWFHADCAYGGAALLAPSVRDRYAGIELVDSFIVDPHKFLFAPFDCHAF